MVRQGRYALAKSRAALAAAMLQRCEVCPRLCGVDRLAGELGRCRTGPGLQVSAVSLHLGEEPVLHGHGGACNVFLTGCSLGCSFCQNHPISHLRVGRPETAAGLCKRVREVLDQGARVVNVVTGTHQVPAVLEGLCRILHEDPDVVVAWNSGGYDRVETLRLLDGIVDVYLPDFKFWSPAVGARIANAPDYPRVAADAILEMARQVGPLVVGADGLAQRGLIVRHLVLPDGLAGTREVLRFIARELPTGTAVSLMGQYVPMGGVAEDPLLGRRLEPEEYEQACSFLESFGIDTGWVQEIEWPED